MLNWFTSIKSQASITSVLLLSRLSEHLKLPMYNPTEMKKLKMNKYYVLVNMMKTPREFVSVITDYEIGPTVMDTSVSAFTTYGLVILYTLCHI